MYVVLFIIIVSGTSASAAGNDCDILFFLKQDTMKQRLSDPDQ